MQLISIRACYSASTQRLSSYKLSWRNPTDQSDIASEWVGPAETTNDICSDVLVPQNLLSDRVKGGAIWYDVFDVQGVQLFYSNNDALTIGATDVDDNTLQRLTQTFGEKSRFIGFFGAQTTTEIQALGFLSVDTDCASGIIPNTGGGGTSSGGSQSGGSSANSSEEDEEDDESNTSTALGVGFGICATVIIAVIICLVAKERNQT